MDACARAGEPLHVLEVLGNAIVGGMETCVVRLARDLPREAFRVSALCPFESGITAALREAGVDVIVTPVRDDPVWQSVQLAATYVLDERVDVIHAHLSNAHVLGALVSGLTQRPCVATIHGRSVPMLDLEAHRLADGMHMCVVCAAAESHARALGVGRDRLHLIRNGAAAAARPFPPGRLQTILGLASHTPLVAYVGRLSPEKAPDLFVRMVSLVARRLPEPAFVVIGDGPMRERLAGDACALGVGARIHFTGARSDVLELLPSLALLVVPSHAEGMSLALMEGMAAGIPIVATSVGGNPEIVENRRTGLLVAPGDANNLAIAVEEILSDRRFARALGERGRERARRLWPQREASLAMGSLLQRVAAASQQADRAAAPPRMRLAARAPA